MTRVVDYALLEAQAAALLEDERDLIANAANLAAFLYHELGAINWAGFYFVDHGSLLLGPFSGRPACTRLPEDRGVCAAAVRNRATIVVDDVHTFDGHIVCDSASQSEIVVPLLKDGAVFGVLDIDSPEKSRFSDADRTGLERIAQRFLELTSIP
ncbi:MAG: GAF domain-containing protein [Vulcanimicrobiaceae bacterium]